MALYHLSVSFVSRSTGRSAVQSVSYITGETLYESRRGLRLHYQNRENVYVTTLIPEGVPEDFKDLRVWDTLESFEDVYAIKRFPHNLEAREKYLQSAQTAMTMVVALPKELSREGGQDLVKDFARTRFVSRGLIATIAIHEDEGNPHAHVQLSRRAVTEKGEISWTKDREICTRQELLLTRKLWAELTNQYLEREGVEERITQKSFSALGVDLLPTQHRGWYADKLYARKKIPSRIMSDNEAIVQENRNRLMENPGLILDDLTRNQATFTQHTLLTALQKRVGEEAHVLAALFEKALEEALVVGEGLDGQVRYTSPSYQAVEDNACARLDALVESKDALYALDLKNVNALLNETYPFLEQEQQDVVRGLTQESRLSVLIGRAGAGKTTTLKAVAHAYQEAGYHVIGVSLSAQAAEHLGQEAGIEAATLHSWLYRWERTQTAQERVLSFDRQERGVKQGEGYQDLQRFEGSKLIPRSVVIVDEAGLIGTRLWSDLFVALHQAGAKGIVVGDDNQLKAIEAGDFFRRIQERAQAAGQLLTLKTIRRQQQEWMRQASQALADLQIQHALSMYEQHGHVHATDSAYLTSEIEHAYLERLQKGQKGVVLAFTNAQVHHFNEALHRRLQAKGLIGSKTLFTLQGKSFSQGDTVVFLKNDKRFVKIFEEQVLSSTFIKNGRTGTLESVDEKGQVTVRLHDHKRAVFGINDYPYLDYGYARTTHKAQGQTVDFTLVAASSLMDAKGLYVALTRHRHDVQLYYTYQEFASFASLSMHLSRFEAKDLVHDYTIRPENKEAWQRVQTYRHRVLDKAALLKNGSIEGVMDWSAYRQIEKDQRQLGKEILVDVQRHKRYLDQAGFTVETLQIATGQKPRPLSWMEERAKLTVQLYVETAQLARTLWRERCSSTSSLSDTWLFQEKPLSVQELRAERDSLAQVILDNYPLHRPFMKAFAYGYGLTKKTLENHVAYRDTKKTFSYPTRSTGPSANAYKKDFSSSLSDSLNSSFFTRSHADLTASLNAHIKDLAVHFFGKPSRQTTKEWRYGHKGSLSIQVAGTKQGLYSHFERGTSGNAVRLIAEQLGLSSQEALTWGANWLYGDDHRRSQAPPSFLGRPKPLREQTWRPVVPAPAEYPDLTHQAHLAPLLKGRHEVAHYTYREADGRLLGYVVRLEDKHRSKITPPLTYCEHEKGERAWRFQGFGDNRPLYGLEALAQRPEAPVLIVEGEKTAEAAKEIFPEYVVLTWSGGCGSVSKSNWSVLTGRVITLWPDHDEPGRQAALTIQRLLREQHHTSSRIVDLPSTFPPKWDLADPVPSGIKIHDFLDSDRYTSLASTINRRYHLESLYGQPSVEVGQAAVTVMNAYQAVYESQGLKVEEEALFKRSVFVVYYMNMIQHLDEPPDIKMRLASIASVEGLKHPSSMRESPSFAYDLLTHAYGGMKDVGKDLIGCNDEPLHKEAFERTIKDLQRTFHDLNQALVRSPPRTRTKHYER